MNSNANVLASAAAVASLADAELEARSVAVNEEAKAITHETLDELGLEYLPTQTNFIMHRIVDASVTGDEAESALSTYIGNMRERGVRVGRPFPPMFGWNRLSFGLPEEMGRWAETLRDFRQRGWV